jgi:tetratricopeptide (TPR) repeat protein
LISTLVSKAICKTVNQPLVAGLRASFFVTVLFFTFTSHFSFAASKVAQTQESSGTVSVSPNRVGDASQFEFLGATDWKYDIKSASPSSGSDQVTLRIPGLKPESMAKLRAHSDALIKSVKINENGLDGAAEVTFKLAPGTDFFDYITEQPSRLIVDFFPKDVEKSKPAAEAKATQKTAALPAKTKSSATVANKGQADGEDEDAQDDEDDSGKVGAKANVENLITKDISAAITGVAGAKAADKGRKPAASEFMLGTVVDQKAPLSLAEQISGEKDFSHGIFDGGDPEFSRFNVKDYEVRDESVIASHQNFYLPFPMLSLGNPQLKAILDNPPVYEIVPADTRENKEARVLLTLFSTGKPALFMKAADEFLHKFPQTSYDEMIRYMLADTHYNYWLKDGDSTEYDTAMGQYQLLTEKYPNSAITQRTMLLMAYSYMDRGDSFGALKNFQRFVRTQATSKRIDQVRVAEAEAYLKLNRFDDAFHDFDDIEKNGKSAKVRSEAAFRKGDVFFRKKDWERSIKEYQAAIERHPETAGNYPNARYNIAEAQFNLTKYREALESYRVFLQKFPDHEHGGYAMTRLGELIGILGADPKRAQGAFLESFFRYRATPGAGIARIKLLTSRMAEMKDKELSNSLREIGEIAQRYANHPVKEEDKTDVKTSEAEVGKESPAKEADVVRVEKPQELPGIEEFTTLLITDGFTARKEFDHATADLISYYQKNPQSPNKDRIKARIVSNITEGIHASVERGDFIDALRRSSKDAGGWLKNVDRVDVHFYVGKAYEQAGVFKEAAKVYRENLKQLAEIKSAGKQREHSVLENPPKEDEVNLRLAAVAAKDKDLQAADSYLKNISTTPNLSDSEQIERAGLLADVAEARGQSELARRYMTDLIKAFKGAPKLTGDIHLRLAKLDIKSRNFKEADAHLNFILQTQKQSEPLKPLISEETHAKALELMGDTQEARGRRREAVQAYQELLEKYESKRPLASIRYKLGKILYQDGDLKTAKDTWEQLKTEKDGLWARLANEQMQSAEWQRDYKKYLNRIPAAVDMPR